MQVWQVRQADVIHQDFNEEVVVIDLASGRYFSMAGVAGRIWIQLSAGQSTASALADMVAANYDVDRSRAATDVDAFLRRLLDAGLVASSDIASPSAHPAIQPACRPDQAGSRPAYEPPDVRGYDDLADLFLLDPVHEVDPAEGWPHAARMPELGGDTAVRAADADIVTAWLPDAAVVVNRDSGRFCQLQGGAAAAWRELQERPIRVRNGAVLEVLARGGLVEPAAASAEIQTCDADGIATIDCSLEEQLRPWSDRVRPARTSTGLRARKLCDELDAWFDATTKSAIANSAHRIADSTIVVKTAMDQPSAALRIALPSSPQIDSDLSPGLVIKAWNGDPARAAPRLAALVESLVSDWRMACGPRGEVVDLHTDVTSAIFTAGPNVLSVVDPAAGRGWLVKSDTEDYPYWEVGSPFRFMLHEYFASQGLQFVHGAAVGDDRGGVLLVGPGGAGKSTTALLCAAAGLRYCGDDYCLVDPRRLSIHAVYGSGKLVGERDLDRLPALRGRSINTDGFEHGAVGKGVFRVDDVWQGSLAATLPLEAIVVPRIDPGAARGWEPCSTADALAALVPSTVGQLPGATAADASRLERIVASVPTFRLALGDDPARIIAAVRELVAACR